MGKFTAITEDEIEIVRDIYTDTALKVKDMEEITGIRAQRIYRIAAVAGVSRTRRRSREQLNKQGPRPALPIAELRSGRCPGKNGRPCGYALRLEPVFNEKGHSTRLWDLVCTVHHRFVMQAEDWKEFFKEVKRG